MVFNLCSNAEADMETIDTRSMLTLLMPIVMPIMTLLMWMLIAGSNADHGKTDARTDLSDADANSALVDSD